MVNDLRFAARMLVKNPGFAIAAIVTLALGVGANTAVFSLVQGVLLHPLPFPEADRLVTVSERRGGSRDADIPVSGHEYQAWRDENHVFARIALQRPDRVALTGTAEPEVIDVWHVSADFFPLLRIEPALGRVFAEGEDGARRQPLAVLSDGLWRRAFAADPAVAGGRIVLDGTAFTVIGVMPTLPRSLSPDAWVALDVPGHVRAVGRHNLNVLARLQPGVPLAAAQADLAAISDRLARQRPADNTDHRVQVAGLRESLVGDVTRALTALAAAVAFVLLIACANVASLLLARGARREGELAVRAALGATRGRIARGLLLESLLLAAAGGALGLLVAAWTTDIVASITVVRIPLLETARLDWRAVAVAGGLALAAGLVSGLVPALRRPADPADALRSHGHYAGDRSRRRIRSALVAAEVALTVVLLVGAGLMINSFTRLVRVDPGFRTDRLLVLSFTLASPRYADAAARRSFYELLLQRLRALPGVQAAGAASHLPLGGADNWMPFAVEGRPAPAPGQELYAAFRTVTPDYFRALGIPLRGGRAFADGDARLAPVIRWYPQQPRPPGADLPQPPPVVVISEAAATRFWPGEDPLGRRIRVLFSDPLTIVGVVGDVRHNALDAPPSPHIYLALSQEPWNSVSVAIRTAGSPLDLAPAARETLRGLDGDLPAEIRTMDEVLAVSVGRPRFYTLLIATFGSVALALAVVGIIGLVSYAAAQRTREIGIRVALGATRTDILALVVRQGMRPVLVGAVAGAAGALIAARFLRALLFDLEPTDPATFAAVLALLAIVALAACWLPARRAAHADPLAALRAD